MVMPDFRKITLKGKSSYKGTELLIPSQAFIYCKKISNDAKQSNLRLSHIYLPCRYRT